VTDVRPAEESHAKHEWQGCCASKALPFCFQTPGLRSCLLYNERTLSLGSCMKIQDARKEFPAVQQQVFLDSACVSLAPQRAVARLRAFLDMAASCPSGSSTQHHLDMDAMRSAARPQIARLINASECVIALVESTTHGLNLVANAIPLQRGDRVVLAILSSWKMLYLGCKSASRSA
jgi:kynureninase